MRILATMTDEPQLTASEIEFLLTSLEYTRGNFDTTEYPTYGMKEERYAQLDQVKAKLRAIRDSQRNS